MKVPILAIVIVNLILIGCKDGSSIENDLFVRSYNDEYSVGSQQTELEILVGHNLTKLNIAIESQPDWIKFKKSLILSEQREIVVFEVAENGEEPERRASVIFSSDDGTLSAKVEVVQAGRAGRDGYYRDGECVQLQSSTVGKGIHIHIIGDGYIEDDLEWGGKYESKMREAMEHFFSVYPYDIYRDHFDVWMVCARSEEEGLNIEVQPVDMKFGSYVYGVYTVAETETVTEYVLKVPGSPPLGELSVILVVNVDMYGGCCYQFESGYTIAVVQDHFSAPMPNMDFRAHVMHEACGHGFGRLGDEYFAPDNEPAEQEIISLLEEWHKSGFNLNVSTTDDPDKIFWKEFLQNMKYTEAFSPIGIYEGGYYRHMGMWRPEETSCMIFNIDYFNAPSRWMIVDRIKKLAGFEYTLEQFMLDDNAPPPTYSGDYRLPAAPLCNDVIRIKENPIVRDNKAEIDIL